MAKIIGKLTPRHYTQSGMYDDGTASTGLTYINWQINTGEEFPIGFTRTNHIPRTSYNSNRQFIRLFETFKSALEKSDLLEQQTRYSLEQKMKLSANLLLKFAPDKISGQLTNDGAVYYTLIINNLTLYFSHYLNADMEDIDECLVSVYAADENILNAGGTMDEVLCTLSSALVNYNITIPELA